MLTEVKAYSSLPSAPQLLLDDNGRAETDLIQVRNIDGLDPVVASVGTSPYGSLDGEYFTGTSVGSRNIVLTIHPNPDWDTWTFESLRRLLYSYFMPKQGVRLVFYSDDMLTVYIDGFVETVSANPFSKDPEFLVSIICPDPYFTAVNPVTLTGNDGDEVDIEYNGSIEAGFQLKVSRVSDPAPTNIQVKVNNPEVPFKVNKGVSNIETFRMSSIPKNKYAVIDNSSVPSTKSVLSSIEVGSEWPLLFPGDNQFSVVTDNGVQNWELTYFERFGGL